MDINVVLILLFVLGGVMTFITFIRGGILFAVIGFGAWIVSMILIAPYYPLMIILYIGLMVLVAIAFFKNSFKGEL